MASNPRKGTSGYIVKVNNGKGTWSKPASSGQTVKHTSGPTTDLEVGPPKDNPTGGVTKR